MNKVRWMMVIGFLILVVLSVLVFLFLVDDLERFDRVNASHVPGSSLGGVARTGLPDLPDSSLPPTLSYEVRA